MSERQEPYYSSTGGQRANGRSGQPGSAGQNGRSGGGTRTGGGHSGGAQRPTPRKRSSNAQSGARGGAGQSADDPYGFPRQSRQGGQDTGQRGRTGQGASRAQGGRSAQGGDARGSSGQGARNQGSRAQGAARTPQAQGGTDQLRSRNQPMQPQRSRSQQVGDHGARTGASEPYARSTGKPAGTPAQQRSDQAQRQHPSQPSQRRGYGQVNARSAGRAGVGGGIEAFIGAHLLPVLIVAALLLVAIIVFGVTRCTKSDDGTQEVEQTATTEETESSSASIVVVGASTAPVSTPKSEWTQGVMPTLYQTDPAWASLPYADDTIAKSGCGPTCLAMVYIYLTGNTDMGVVEMCAFADENNYAPSGATEWSFMTEGAATLGLSSDSLSCTRSSFTSALEAGQPIICSMKPGTFTKGGHYIVVAAIDEDGMCTVYDPNSSYRTAQLWPIQLILTQCNIAWAFSVEA